MPHYEVTPSSLPSNDPVVKAIGEVVAAVQQSGGMMPMSAVIMPDPPKEEQK